MREIKFRVWNDSKLQEIDFYWFEEQMCREMSDIPIEVGDGCVLMQYTGLKDKNGKEIYEGDVCFDSFIKSKCIVDEITWALWVLDDNKMDFPSSRIEVIGNIYENPELIKDK